MAVCHCATDGCHRTFSSVSAFDAHLRGVEPVAHMDPAAVRGLTLRADGVWTLRRTTPRPPNWRDDTGAVDLATVIGLLSVIASLVAFGFAIATAAPLGAAVPAVTSALCGISIGAVAVTALLGRWLR